MSGIYKILEQKLLSYQAKLTTQLLLLTKSYVVLKRINNTFIFKTMDKLVLHSHLESLRSMNILDRTLQRILTEPPLSELLDECNSPILFTFDDSVINVLTIKSSLNKSKSSSLSLIAQIMNTYISFQTGLHS